MSIDKLDYNSLRTLQALLIEQNITQAAKRLNLSPSAMSRALGRLRLSMQDPLLIRAGQKMCLTPRAIALQHEIFPLIEQIEKILSPVSATQIESLARCFTLRCSEGFVENFGPRLIRYLAVHAPYFELRFVMKHNKNNLGLREGSIDLETTVVGQSTGLDMRSRILFQDRFIGVARMGHPISQATPSIESYTAAQHVLVMRDFNKTHPIDSYLKKMQLTRQSQVSVASFTAALALVRHTDLIATVPERYTDQLCSDLYRFELPFDLQPIPLSLLWHPRFDADQAHAWLRQVILALCDTN